MELLFIGGVANGESHDLSSATLSARHAFKRVGDFASEAQHYHDYERQVYVVRREGGAEEGVPFMVLDGLPKGAIVALIEQHADVKVVS